MQTTTIRPGLLVSLKTTVRGNVSYQRRDLEREHIEEGALKSKWETERTIDDPAEFEAAGKIRSKARSMIAGVCAWSSFGLLCPQSRADELAEAITQAQTLAADFNARAALTSVQVYVIAGRIASDDVEATRAINNEVRDLLDAMESGVRNLDAEAIRDAAKRARSIGTMLTADASSRLAKAIDTVRSTARQIVKAGEAAALEIDQRAIRAITESRTAFIDLDDARELAQPVTTGRAIDMDTAPLEAAAAPQAPQFELL